MHNFINDPLDRGLVQKAVPTAVIYEELYLLGYNIEI
jgi:hypothetical protein